MSHSDSRVKAAAPSSDPTAPATSTLRCPGELKSACLPAFPGLCVRHQGHRGSRPPLLPVTGTHTEERAPVSLTQRTSCLSSLPLPLKSPVAKEKPLVFHVQAHARSVSVNTHGGSSQESNPPRSLTAPLARHDLSCGLQWYDRPHPCLFCSLHAGPAIPTFSCTLAVSLPCSPCLALSPLQSAGTQQ